MSDADRKLRAQARLTRATLTKTTLTANEAEANPIRGVEVIRRNPDDLFGCLKDRIRINGDILSTGIGWESSD